jgi:hypothetical protein
MNKQGLWRGHRPPPDAFGSPNMNNPWTKLEASRNGYVLDEDLDAVNEFNRSVTRHESQDSVRRVARAVHWEPGLGKSCFPWAQPRIFGHWKM